MFFIVHFLDFQSKQDKYYNEIRNMLQSQPYVIDTTLMTHYIFLIN